MVKICQTFDEVICTVESCQLRKIFFKIKALNFVTAKVQYAKKPQTAKLLDRSDKIVAQI